MGFHSPAVWDKFERALASLTPGVVDHGALTGLADDDHLQYLTAGRGDALYDALGEAEDVVGVHELSYDHTLLHSSANDWRIDGSSYLIPPASHPVTPITHQAEELGQLGREWGKLWAKNAYLSGKLGIFEAAPTELLEVHSESENPVGLYKYNDAQGGPSIIQHKSRGNKAGPTLPSNNDFLGSQIFTCWDTAGWQNSVVMRGACDGAPTLGDTPGRFVVYTTPSGATTVVERLRVNNLGNVGINKTVFGSTLEKGLCLGTGVAATTWSADACQMWVADIVAGEAALHIASEHGDIIKLYQQAHLANLNAAYAVGDLDTEGELLTAINAINTRLNAYQTYFENWGLVASA